MCLIDADLEIEKINSEIERMEEKIKVWKERESLNDAGMYDVGMEIASLRKNITNCKMEIAMLSSYSTAFDVDKVVEELENRSVLARPIGWSKAYEIITLKYAIEVVKEGGIK